ncbi:MAG: arsenate reductase (glutaredoxin) [Vicingaceae bacterium]
MKIYHNPRCTKSRETLAILKEEGQDFEIVEYLKEVPSKEELNQLLAKLNMKPEELLRKGEKVFKEKFKGKQFGDEEWVQIMIENPKLIERPIVVKGNKAVIGRPPETVKELF